jgi:hypothetical protein
VVHAFAAATATQAGNLVIGSRTLTVAAAAHLPASVKAGANLCATLTLNALGQVQGASIAANVAAAVSPSASDSAGGNRDTGGSSARADVSVNAGPVTANGKLRVLGESVTQSQPATGGNGSGAGPGTGGNGGQAGAAPAQGNRGDTGALPNTASFGRVLDLAARTAIPITAIGLALLTTAGTAAIRRRRSTPGGEQ